MRTLIALAVVALVACDAAPTQMPAPTPIIVSELRCNQGTQAVCVREVCIDGVLYLTTERGGITPKMRSWATDANSGQAYVTFCKGAK